jgi:hypothetical protein
VDEKTESHGNCCYMVLDRLHVVAAVFLYVVAYFPDLGSVGYYDCCSRSKDVGKFFFLFHIYLPPQIPGYSNSLSNFSSPTFFLTHFSLLPAVRKRLM